MIQPSYTILRAVKGGNEPRELEDWAARNEWPNIDGAYRVAVADGATESSFSKQWAKQIARGFCKQPFFEADAAITCVDGLSKKWASTVFRSPLPWYAEEKARQGADAAFVGLEFRVPDLAPRISGEFTCVAIGDSCLFHVRGDEMLLAFPIATSSGFTNTPALVSSIPRKNRVMAKHLVTFSGQWQTGDWFILASDAMSQWALLKSEQGYPPWKDLIAREGAKKQDAAFSAWVSEQRRDSLRNDDVVCALIGIAEA